jgi:N-acetyl-anhydromuramyl-L-alanine amidase AmpD
VEIVEKMENEIIEKKSPNFKTGRENFEPKAFVIHVSEGNFQGTLNWCLNPSTKVSYHFLVKEDGQIYKLVDTENTAWHAGLAVKPTWTGHTIGRNPNLETIGIAFAGFASEGPSLPQILAIRELILELSAVHRIPLDRKNIIGHNEIRADKICPGPKLSLDAVSFLCQLK